MRWRTNIGLHNHLNCYISIPLVLFSGFVAWTACFCVCLDGCDVRCSPSIKSATECASNYASESYTRIHIANVQQ